MLRFIIGRVLLIVPVLFGVSIIVFMLVQLAPGDVTSALLGPMGSENAKEVLRAEMGLDRPLPVQYAKWLAAVVQGDFGTSWVHKRPVSEIIFPKFVNTALLAGSAALLAYVLGFSSGLFAAAKSGTLYDRSITALVLIAGSIPLYWGGLMLVLLFSLTWRWLPATGMTKIVGGGGVLDVLEHLVLPAVAASLPSAALISRITRATMIEILSQNYIRVARAKACVARSSCADMRSETPCRPSSPWAAWSSAIFSAVSFSSRWCSRGRGWASWSTTRLSGANCRRFREPC